MPLRSSTSLISFPGGRPCVALPADSPGYSGPVARKTYGSSRHRSLHRAMELNPNYPQAYGWNGARLMMIGKYDESLASIQRGLEIDPTSNGINYYKGVCLAIAGRRDEAVQQFKKTIAMDPTFPWTHNFLSRIYRWNGDYAASIEERAISLELDGYLEEARRVRESFTNGGWSGFQRMLQQTNSGVMSGRELGAAEKDATIEKLNRMAAEGSFWLFLIKADPLFDPFRADPRFQELVKKFDPTN